MNNIFNQKLFLGYISKISASKTLVHVPSSTYLNKFFHYGEKYHGGILNSYIVIEGEHRGFIGRITSAEIPEKERLEFSSEAIKYDDFHPLLQIEILSEFDYYKLKFQKSIVNFPNIGSKVYIASNLLVEKYLYQIEQKYFDARTNGFAKILTPHNEFDTDFSLQNLFGKHAAIVGTTGSGKSWTTSSLVINLLENKQKVILIDPTGEYSDLADNYCDSDEKVVLGETHILSYKKLTIQDLFHLLTPAPATQAPKLREAIRSLKLLQINDPDLKNYKSEDNLTLIKSGKDRNLLIDIFNRYSKDISSDNCNFDIRGLAVQIENECIWSSDRNEPRLFGGEDHTALGHCTSLITRIESLIKDEFYNNIFDFQQYIKKPDLIDILLKFIDQNEGFLFYIDMSKVPFTFQMREIVVDIIGQTLLNLARKETFKNNPLTIFIDEAHQFLNKNITNDYDYKKLDAFENIAKEGRKYGLFLCITTQLPRDIPDGILSQIGTFITHRLINQRDKEIIMHSLPTIRSNVIKYLPTLGQGEAIISSSELTDNLYIKVNPPLVEPNSNTPQYSQIKDKSNKGVSNKQKTAKKLIHA